MNSGYSLVLSDEVVAACDKEAYRKGVSRSTLINEILAERLSYVTPKKRMEDIFSQMEEHMRATELRLLGRANTAMDFAAAINYRYNPTVRYGVALYDGGEDVGEVRVSLRTQNAALIAHVTTFFNLFDRLDRTLLPVRSTVEVGRYVRIIPMPNVPAGKREEDVAGGAIISFINRFNALLSVYFDALSLGKNPEAAVVKAYQNPSTL